MLLLLIIQRDVTVTDLHCCNCTCGRKLMSTDEYLEDKCKLIDACILASEKYTYNMSMPKYMVHFVSIKCNSMHVP